MVLLIQWCIKMTSLDLNLPTTEALQQLKFKGTVHPKIGNSVVIYSPKSCSRSV